MKLKVKFFFIATVILLMIWSCRKHDTNETLKNNAWYSGGRQTFFDQSVGAFDHIFNGLNPTEIKVHEIGDKAFDAVFVSAPAPLNSGLGPIYNNVSCVSCHVNDGRGRPPVPGSKFESLLFKISTDGKGLHGEPIPVLGYGTQIQMQGVNGVSAEANIRINYQNITELFSDGSSVVLQKPVYQLEQLYKPINQNYYLSPRLAPPVFGLGLLEAIPMTSIVANQDPQDANGDGISGKANWVWDKTLANYNLGRFGWKAGQPSILQQISAAYNEDMGVTNPLFSIENSFSQIQYDGLNDDVELKDSILHAVKFYMQTLGVPARRLINTAEVVQGEKLFYSLKCQSCHIPSFITQVDVSFPSRSYQKIYPYTDLLLHDMGVDLSDNRPEFDADGQEWKTPALWGIGLTEKVNGHAYYLHDGRARSIEEAILWHGGEAEQSKNRYKQLSLNERQAVLKFIHSL